MHKFRLLKNGKIAREKKWHKTLIKNVIVEIETVCPILDLKNKNLYISLDIDKYNSLSNIIFGYKSFENEIFKVTDIMHNKDKILQMGSNYGLVTY